MRKFVLLFLLVGTLGAADWTEADKKAFQTKVERALDDSRRRVENIFKEMGRSGTILTAADKIRLENAKTQMEVKETIAANFANAASLSIKKVRDELMQVLISEQVTMQDLARLQQIVNEEKAKQ